MLEKLKNKSVGIAGCGGLGSNCAVALARVGIGELIIVDFDIVEEGNLNRQYYFLDQVGMKKVDALETNLKRINKEVKIVKHDIKIERNNLFAIFKDCDVIVEAFDLAEMKKMLIETLLDKLPEKHVVSGIGLGGWGNNNSIHTIQHGNIYICGDEKTESNDSFPPLAPRVGIVSHMQANQVLEILLNKKTDENHTQQ